MPCPLRTRAGPITIHVWYMAQMHPVELRGLGGATLKDRVGSAIQERLRAAAPDQAACFPKAADFELEENGERVTEVQPAGYYEVVGMWGPGGARGWPPVPGMHWKGRGLRGGPRGS